jgi:hypothetical protein
MQCSLKGDAMKKENCLFYEDNNKYKQAFRLVMILSYMCFGAGLLSMILFLIIPGNEAFPHEPVTINKVVLLILWLLLAVLINIYIVKGRIFKVFVAIASDKVVTMNKELYEYKIADIAKCAVVRENTRTSKILITLNDDKAWLLIVRDAEKFKNVLDGLLAAKAVPPETDADQTTQN